MEAATEPKPLPHPEAVFDDKVAALDNAAIEAWGERVRAAGARVCEWLNEAVPEADYNCAD